MKSPTIIYSTPALWDLIPNKEMKINSTGEEIVQIKYGEAWYDDESGFTDLTIYMRKEIYDKVISGHFKLHKRGYNFYITDRDGQEIDAYLPGLIY